MKGPAGRLKCRVRRYWECPRCHRACWTGGHVVTRACEACTTVNPPQIFWMRLVEKPADPSPAARAAERPGNTQGPANARPDAPA